MIPAEARRAGGIIGCAAAGVAVVVILLLLAPAEVPPAEQADAAGRSIWLLLGGGCVVPAGMFYGWLVGAWVAGRVIRFKSR